jgi:hypothetical protein
MYGARSATAPKTTNNLGTKLSVISCIEVAACTKPMIKPIPKAIANKGPAVITICQKA